jgi:hypothetical protein
VCTLALSLSEMAGQCSMRGRTWLLLFYLVALAVVAFALVIGNLDFNVLLAALTAPATIWAAAKDELPRPANQLPPVDRIENDFAWRPLAVVAVVVAYLQLVARALGALLGAAAGQVLEIVGHPDLAVEAVASVSWMLLLPLAVAIVPITIWAGHRLKEGALRWVLLAVSADRIITAMVYLLLLEVPLSAWPTAMALELAVGAILVPPVALGLWWSGRTYREYVTSRLVNALPSEEQAAIV